MPVFDPHYEIKLKKVVDEEWVSKYVDYIVTNEPVLLDGKWVIIHNYYPESKRYFFFFRSASSKVVVEYYSCSVLDCYAKQFKLENDI